MDSRPSSNVTMNLSSSDMSEATLSVTSVVFTVEDWNYVQTVTVTGVGDVFIDGNINYTIQTSVASSYDTNYNGVALVADVDLVNIDGEFALWSICLGLFIYSHLL